MTQQNMIVEHWDRALAELSPENKDIYFNEAYCRLYERGGRQARAFVRKEGQSVFVFPFLLGEIPNAPGLSDFETPYGYGGPVTNDFDPLFVHRAMEAFAEQCADNRIVAGFVRFHPLLGNDRIAAGDMDVFTDRETVSIDLSMPEEEIWIKQIQAKNRNTIRKSRKNSLEFFADDSFAIMETFRHLYTNTMMRLHADSFYGFDDRYFSEFAGNLAGKAFIGAVRDTKSKGRIAAAALFMIDKPWCHYHLAGSDSEYSASGANNLLLYEAALELKRRGATCFHLGGGTDGSPVNSLFAFKKKFSTFRHMFCTGRKIFLADEYARLCSNWATQCPEKIARYGSMTLRYRF